MIDERTKLNARDTDLTALAQRYGVALHRHGNNELAGACPCPGCTAQRDGFHVNTALNRWRCYTCHPDAWYDAVELVKACEALTYPAAVQWLLGGSTPTPRIAKQAATQQQPVKSWDAAKAAAFLQQAQDRLWGDNVLGEQARAYLESRGLDAATWLNFGLGVANVKTGAGSYAPAIAMPWLVRGELVSLAFRFLEPQGEQRYSRWGSAANRLFGNHANLDAANTLVLCEGELNACSIWQAAHHTRLHVLSTGKQVDRLPDAAVKVIAKRYDTMIVWADEPEVSAKLQQQIAAQARGIVGAMHSPTQEGAKLDANALLQRGELGGMLSEYRLSLAQEQGQLDRLCNDLLHGARSMQGLDAGSADVLQRLAARVNMPLDLQNPESNRWIVFS